MEKLELEPNEGLLAERWDKSKVEPLVTEYHSYNSGSKEYHFHVPDYTQTAEWLQTLR